MNGQEFYSPLLSEAQQSPNLLEDLAALEGYLAETYSSRAFIELLQNADDAGATVVQFSFDEHKLISSNNGKPFTPEDVQGLCRSGKSSKSRGSAIGYRGIGFKSTAALSSQILVSSGAYCFKFSRELTAQALGSTKPMPLIRIPHFGKVADDEWALISSQGLTIPEHVTTFVFDVIDLVALESEFENFRPDYLLFLNNVREVRLDYQGSLRVFFRSERRVSPDEKIVTLNESETGQSIWYVVEQPTFSVACATVSDAPSTMRQDASLFHSFLPTNETTGLGVRINADFSTDPSRTKITLDDHTLEILNGVAEFIAKCIISIALGEVSAIGAVIAPESMQAAFNQSNKSVKFLLQELVKQNVKASEVLTNYRTRPSWAGNISFQPKSSSGASAPMIINSVNEEQSSFFKAIGLRSISPTEILKHYEVSEWSRESRAALIGQIVGVSALASHEEVELATSSFIWESDNGGPLPLLEFLGQKSSLSPDFLELLHKTGASPAMLRNLVQRVNPSFGDLFKSGQGESNASEAVKKWNVLGTERSTNLTSLQGKHELDEPMWRTAELYVLSRLRQEGFEANDVSRQFVGYDIHARIGGTEYFVEVKKVSSFSEPLSLTSNEQAFAGQMADKYILAVVSASASAAGSTLAFIQNPVAKLDFERQCQKWVWECSSYREYLEEVFKP